MTVRAALFDLDRTLVRVNTTSLYVRHRRDIGQASWRDSVRMAVWLARYAVGIMPGVSSSVTGQHGDFVRVPFGYRPDVLTDGMQRVAKAWRDYIGARSRADRTCVLV